MVCAVTTTIVNSFDGIPPQTLKAISCTLFYKTFAEMTIVVWFIRSSGKSSGFSSILNSFSFDLLLLRIL